jgi:hypothetical protein
MRVQQPWQQWANGRSGAGAAAAQQARFSTIKHLVLRFHVPFCCVPSSILALKLQACPAAFRPRGYTASAMQTLRACQTFAAGTGRQQQHGLGPAWSCCWVSHGLCGQGGVFEQCSCKCLVVILITCIKAVIAAKQKDDGRITRAGGGTLLARLSKLQASRQRPCPRSTISGSAS